MHALPILGLLSLAVCLGLFMGVQYLRGERRRPVVIGVHILAGLGSLEPMAVLVREAADATLARAAMIVVALALMGGLGSALLRRQSRRASEAALVAHACAALSALALLTIWIGS